MGVGTVDESCRIRLVIIRMGPPIRCGAEGGEPVCWQLDFRAT
jgi:hypothetical protein